MARVKLPEYLYSGVKNRSYIDNAKAHLTLWKTLIAKPRNGIKIEWLYHKIVGILNNISYFKSGYKNV
ncbi:hypothetical protein ACN9OT_12370, partial [Glaesserella parasuis]